MYIKRINVYMKDLDLVRPYTIAFKKISSVENGIVEIEADNGMRGYGSFNPSVDVVGETVQDAFRVLNEENLSFLIRRDIRELNLICYEIQQKFKMSPGARAGLEIALYDLFCQFPGIPLVSFLGKKIDSMPTSVTIGIKNVEETLEEAKEYIGRRFRILKVKTGESAEEDIERLIKLREFAGSDITVIIDANQGYSCSDLKLFLDKTAGLNISLIEQPLAVGEEACLRQMSDNIKERLVADESLITPGDAMRLAREPEAFGNYNIKLMKCGGISEALKIAGIAEENKTGLMWGCNDESIISITAALHTAFACRNTRYIDLDGSLDLTNDVVKGGFILKDGIMSISEKPGLGLTLL
jgi:L-Ala-D/L-Glu epimerase